MKNIYIAKHYWENGENSKWECHKKIDRKLFQYIKDNYHSFEKEQPKMIHYHQLFIYLCYEQSKDIYDREIVNITFFITQNLTDENLCIAEYVNLEIKGEKKLIESPLLILGIITFILLLFYFFSSKKTIHNEYMSNTQKHLMSLPHQIQNLKDFNHLDEGLKEFIALYEQNASLVSSETLKERDKLNGLLQEYKKVLTQGINVTIKIQYNQKHINYKKFYLDQNLYTYNHSAKLQAKEYRFHLVLSNRYNFIDGKITFNKDELIKLYQDSSSVINKNINGFYSIQIKKFE